MSELIKSNQIEIAKYDPILMARTCSEIKSISDAVAKDQNSIALVRKEIGEQQVMSIIEAHLFTLNESLNTHEKLSQLQCVEITVEILATYYYLSITEIHYVLRMAKRGDYGKINYSINMPDVLSWFNDYSEKRIKHFMEENTKHRHNDTSDRSEEKRIKARHELLINQNQKDK